MLVRSPLTLTDPRLASLLEEDASDGILCDYLVDTGATLKDVLALFAGTREKEYQDGIGRETLALWLEGEGSELARTVRELPMMAWRVCAPEPDTYEFGCKNVFPRLVSIIRRIGQRWRWRGYYSHKEGDCDTLQEAQQAAEQALSLPVLATRELKRRVLDLFPEVMLTRTYRSKSVQVKNRTRPVRAGVYGDTVLDEEFVSGQVRLDDDTILSYPLDCRQEGNCHVLTQTVPASGLIPMRLE